jgi:hypothetical protein
MEVGFRFGEICLGLLRGFLGAPGKQLCQLSPNLRRLRLLFGLVQKRSGGGNALPLQFNFHILF